MIRFELVTLNGTKFSEEVHEVMLPTPDGIIAVFTGHAPLVSLASTGVINVRRKQGDSDERMETYATNGGVIEILDDGVRVLVDEADQADEINEQEAQESYEHARRLLKEAKHHIELEHAQSLMDRHAVRIKVAGLRRSRRSTYK